MSYSEQVGLGERLAPLVARHLLPPEFVDSSRPGTPTAPLAISGTEGLLVSYARCCFPIPYEPIIAFLSTGRGVVVHRANCTNLDGWHKQPEKWLPVQWQENVEKHTFTTELKVLVQNRPGSLAAVAPPLRQARPILGTCRSLNSTKTRLRSHSNYKWWTAPIWLASFGLSARCQRLSPSKDPRTVPLNSQ
jgi:GTP pyrophosphokinase